MIEYGPKLITNGLIMYLDAANYKSYSGSGSAWHDISGNGNEGTLINGPTFSSSNFGMLNFDGSNKYVQTIVNQSVTQCTIICALRKTANVAYGGICYSRGTPNTSGLGLFSDGNTLAYTWNGDPATYNWDSTLTITNSVWHIVGLQLEPTKATLSVDGATAVNITTHASSLINNMQIATDDTIYNREFNGNIALVMIYNRCLSVSEFSQNYNALKTRFNL